MLRDIHLHGALGKRFGRHHRFDVATPGEAVRALCSQYKGFREALSVGQWKLVRGDRKTGQELGRDEVDLRLGAAPLHIIPVPAGAGGRGTGKVIAGIALIAAAFAFAYYAPFGVASGGLKAATAGAAATSGALNWSAVVVPSVLSASGLAQAGLALTLVGVSALLAPQPKAPNFGSTAERNDSYLLTGPTNTNAEGVPVPLIYGRCRVGSVVASAGISVEDWQASANIDPPPGGKLGVLDWGRT